MLSSLESIVLFLEGLKGVNKTPTATEWVTITKALIQLETKPGGPYTAPKKVAAKLNARLRVVLTQNGINLDSTLPKSELRGEPRSEILVAEFPPTMRPKAQKYLKRICSDQHLLGPNLLPYTISKILKKTFSDQARILDDLAKASVFGWLSYTMADQVIDGEDDPQLVPIMLSATRKMLELFLASHNDPDYIEAIYQELEKVDCANLWELNEARFCAGEKIILPGLERDHYLQDKSGAHILSAWAIILHSGHKLSDPICKDITQAVRDYCAARQLIDDLRDFEADYGAGIISYPIREVLKMYLEAKPSSLNWPKFEEIREILMGDAHIILINDAIEHLKKANFVLALPEIGYSINKLERAKNSQTKRDEFIKAWKVSK